MHALFSSFHFFITTINFLKMAFRTLSKRLFNPTTLKNSLIPTQPPNLRHDTGYYSRRFLAINNHTSTESYPTFLTLPIGEKLREKIKNVAGDHRLRHPKPSEVDDGLFSMHASDLKRVMRFVQLEKVRNRLRNIPANTVLYAEFLRVCEEVCGSREIGLEFAKVLDECGNVIVLGGVVFLRPDQVVKSMEKLISQTISMPNDPRKKELENLETIKALIDKKAQSQVRSELYCGLGFLLVQTLGFMRLTFWELSWDVMEPICFFVTSFHFALAYTFFLKTSNEPTFEGYFRRRFYTKQKKLMKILKFDVERYNQLHEAFYPGHSKLELNKTVP